VQDITHIINYDLPDDPEVYVHRVGRTARMGAKGKAFSFVSKDQGELLTKVENLINMEIPVLRVDGFESSPPPADWLEKDPNLAPPSENATPVQSRFSRPLHQSGSTASATPAAPVTRTIGSKIPVSRRKKRLR
jgi:ATP-dependent RNA helicase RhlE